MILALATLALAGAEADLATANAALEAGDRAEAARGYRAVVEAGRASGAVYYNLGNVLYREERLPLALLAWRRAGALLPRDPDVQANLDFARRGVRDHLQAPDPVPTFAPWQGALTPDEGVWIGAAVAGLGLLAIALRRRTERVPLLPLGVLVGGIGAVVAAGGVAEAAMPPAAVVVRPEVVARSDLGGGVDLFTLHAGAEVRTLESGADHVLVRLDDGRKGWVDADAVGLVDPTSPFPVL